MSGRVISQATSLAGREERKDDAIGPLPRKEASEMRQSGFVLDGAKVVEIKECFTKQLRRVVSLKGVAVKYQLN